MSIAAFAATRSSDKYSLVSESPDSGGAGFSASYANRATVEPVTGYEVQLGADGLPYEVITFRNP